MVQTRHFFDLDLIFLLMFYRRKIVLSILQGCGGRLNKVAIQKLLFLFASRQIRPEYEFVPYLYGCYSFSAAADFSAMIKHGHLAEVDDAYVPTSHLNYSEQLKDADRAILKDIVSQFGNTSTQQLIKHTYMNYQYYAINSSIGDKVLTREKWEQIQSSKPTSTKTILYTIGYEGSSLENYLNRLIQNDVRVLVDVRANPLSMKFGFSKNQLKDFCGKLHIRYVHIPQVGIKSEYRQELTGQPAYDELFVRYNQEIIPQTLKLQQEILQLLADEERIALTCFEADICQCHRTHLARAITKLPDWKYEVIHI